MALNVSRKFLITMLVLYVGEVFLLGQGVIAAMAVLVGVFILLMGAWSMLRRNREKAKARGRTAFVLIGTALLALASISVNNALAEKRCRRLIADCEQYHAKYNKYPDRLEQLVPEFISSVPLAKYTMQFNDFSYMSSPERHTIMYVAFPPFGRPYYVFETHRWGYLD
ncbi:MAG TPA: hypothetical protein VF786_06845 [Terriglobales bacterium]